MLCIHSTRSNLSEQRIHRRSRRIPWSHRRFWRNWWRRSGRSSRDRRHRNRRRLRRGFNRWLWRGKSRRLWRRQSRRLRRRFNRRLWRGYRVSIIQACRFWSGFNGGNRGMRAKSARGRDRRGGNRRRPHSFHHVGVWGDRGSGRLARLSNGSGMEQGHSKITLRCQIVDHQRHACVANRLFILRIAYACRSMHRHICNAVFIVFHIAELVIVQDLIANPLDQLGWIVDVLHGFEFVVFFVCLHIQQSKNGKQPKLQGAQWSRRTESSKYHSYRQYCLVKLYEEPS